MLKNQNKLYRADQVRAMDQYAIKQLGVSGTVLMERAGESAFALVQKRWPQARSVAVVCGTGNNGGDGYVLARLAASAGLDVRLLTVGDSNSLHGDALAASQRVYSTDLTAVPFDKSLLRQCDLVVDAILGIGLRGEVDAERDAVITAINESGLPVLALDIPSGLNADTGHVQGNAIRADATLTFVALKRGLFTGEALNHCGEVFCEDLNLPDAAFVGQHAEVRRIRYDHYTSLLSPRPRDSHKGDYGHVLIIGGETGYTGAVRMAGEAAARVGAGLVSIATRASHAALLNTGRPELMVHGVEEEAAFNRLSERATVLVVGPGLGQGPWALQMLQLALDSGLPLVMDADALNLLSQAPRTNRKWILTPHSGEAARLLGQSTQEIQRDRFAAVLSLQSQYGGIAILKGAGSLVAGDTQEPVALCTDGNPGMASGGMGDILSGIIAGLVAQGLERWHAACLGVCLHARAGDAAAAAAGQRGLLASDLMSWIRRLANP